MKLLLMSADYPPSTGGVATHVANLAHELLKIEDSYSISVIANDEQNSSPIKKGGGRVEIWQHPFGTSPIFNGHRAPYEPLIKFVLEKWKRHFSSDIIHAHDLDSAYAGWMIKIAYDVPLVVSIHRAPVLWKKRKYRESAKDLFVEAIKRYQFVDRIIVPSNASKHVLLQQGLDKNKISVIPHGLNYEYLSHLPEEIPTIEDILPTDNYKLILCPIRADEHKDPILFLRAAQLLKARITGVKLFFVLTDISNEQYNLEDHAQVYGLDVGEKKDVVFKRFQYREMAALYRKASVCVMPSQRESFGQTVLESFHFKVPVVATNDSGLSEIIEHGVNGLLFNRGSAEDLATQIQNIIEDSTLAEALIKAGSASLINQFSARDMAKKYDLLYKEILGNNAR